MLCAAGLLAAAGCADPACDGAPRLCLDHETVRDCTVRPVTDQWCPGACADAGASMFTACRSDAPDPCGCASDPAAPLPCTPGETVCLDERTLLRCGVYGAIGDDGFWEATDCVSRCLSLGALTGICAVAPADDRLEGPYGGPGCFCDANGLVGAP